MTRTRRKPPWYQHFPTRLRFEREARAAYPHISMREVGARKRSEVAYGLKIPVPEYEDRSIELVFPRMIARPEFTRVYADGPTESPHRYRASERDKQGRSSLCIWDPDDPPELRWVPEDGLLSLIEMTRLHLFKEAYWRETGDWPGAEAPHPTAEPKPC
ncbi:MAG TPA: hypothetical protein VNO20_09075 [Solirubrobacterales bacterium]|nr:hypothetical protein [Solirubrobacterales bacterium]